MRMQQLVYLKFKEESTLFFIAWRPFPVVFYNLTPCLIFQPASWFIDSYSSRSNRNYREAWNAFSGCPMSARSLQNLIIKSHPSYSCVQGLHSGPSLKKIIIDSQVESHYLWGNMDARVLSPYFRRSLLGPLCEWVCTFIMDGDPCNAFVNEWRGCCFFCLVDDGGIRFALKAASRQWGL